MCANVQFPMSWKANQKCVASDIEFWVRYIYRYNAWLWMQIKWLVFAFFLSDFPHIVIVIVALIVFAGNIEWKIESLIVKQKNFPIFCSATEKASLHMMQLWCKISWPLDICSIFAISAIEYWKFIYFFSSFIFFGCNSVLDNYFYVSLGVGHK